MNRIFNLVIDENLEGKNIKTILKQYFMMSENLIKQLKSIPDGITVNGEHKNVTYILNYADNLKIKVVEQYSNSIEPHPVPFKIIYEDEDIMIVDKPFGIPTHPSAGNYTHTLANGVIYYFNSKGENRIFRAVNRLDKDTSGLMCIAKNSYSHARLCQNLHQNLVRKYTAAVEGIIENDGEITLPIARLDKSVIKRCVDKNGLWAKTYYKVLKVYHDFTLVELELETGRTHQIRVHMSYIGHPLLGDWLYGSERSDMRTALHSSYLSLSHPVTGEKLQFYSPVNNVPNFFMR